MLGPVKRLASQFIDFIKATSSKVKRLLTVAGTTGLIVATNAQAAINYDAATGFTGAIDTIPFTSAAVIAASFVGLIVAVGAGFAALRKAR